MNKNIPFELETTANLSNYNRWIAESFYPFAHGSLVEIGAGIGTFSELFVDRFDSLTLIEPSSGLCEGLQKRYATENHIEIVQSSLESLIAQPAGKNFDCALMVNVLEHIQNDKDALRMMFNILKLGGYLLIFVPAQQSLFSELDKAVGHYRRYHLPDLKQKVETAGFEIVKLQYLDWLGVAAWWLVNIIFKQKNINANSAVFYDRFGIPLTRWIESVIKPPFGKNLILVAKKR